MRITFLGSGDAFSTGGRFHTCLLVETKATRFLIDCGGSAITAIQQRGVDTNTIGTIVLTHLHGDHFGGLPYVLLDGQFDRRRTAGLMIAGPPGSRSRIAAMMEALYPGMWERTWRFPIEVVELAPRTAWQFDAVAVTPYVVEHAPESTCLALRIACGGTTIAYSGDTQWTPALVEAARGTDLFVCECNSYDRAIPGHTDLPTLVAHRRELETKRLILTHLGPAMLAHADTLPYEYAVDGLSVTV
jgi:ribonuclease BN (tRNA processing enzyme)